ncbi:protein stum homolog isoform X1 [Mugil cephalus]|uniref:protein stum homolog isoform X1 n=1 Tax=Mugil cephalus TaxID=48193 RepID=UPI001FB5D2D9|nr:protein stum homolog isoform X1 [Mugil cephalus]
MAQKEGGTERVKAEDNAGTKAVVGSQAAGGGVVVEVREKKGPLRAAIPTMPFPLAVICLFLNTFIPGLGTFISAFTVLCGARSELISERGVCCVFWLNVAAALLQILTAVIMVGWIMSIFWGMDMVILAMSWRNLKSVKQIVTNCFLCLLSLAALPPSSFGWLQRPGRPSGCLREASLTLADGSRGQFLPLRPP